MTCALLGCHGDDAQAPAEGKDTLVIGAMSEPLSLAGVFATVTTTQNLAGLATPAPVTADFNCATSFQPGLYKAWERADDGKSLTVHLDERYRWEDGTPVVAGDFAKTWALVCDPAAGSPRASACGRLEEKRRPEVVDDHTLVFGFDKPTQLEAMMSDVIQAPIHPGQLAAAPPPAAGAPASEGPWWTKPEFSTKPIGYGPWKLASWTPKVRMEFVPSPTFGIPEQAPHLAKVVAAFIPDHDARLAALQAGEIDVMEGVTAEDIAKLEKESPTIELRRRGWRVVEFAVWNPWDPAAIAALRKTLPENAPLPPKTIPDPRFASPEVRTALTELIDTDKLIRETMTDTLTGDVYGRPAVGTTNPNLCGVYDDAIQHLPHDVDDAKAKLAAQGWTDRNGDGILDDGRGHDFRFTLLANAAQPREVAAAKQIAADLAVAGIEARVEPLPVQALQKQVRDGTFDAVVANFSTALVADPSSLWSPTAPANFTGLTDPALDAAMEQIAAGDTPDHTAAKAFQARLYELQPYTFLYWADDVVAVDGRFQNTRVDLIYPWGDLWRWTVPADKVKYK